MALFEESALVFKYFTKLSEATNLPFEVKAVRNTDSTA